MKQISKVELRRQATCKASQKILQQIVSGEIEVYVRYRHLYSQWCTNDLAVPELRPMFRIPDIEPNGTLSVTGGFKSQIT